MREVLWLIPAGAAGFLLGAMFFGGLWWTVRKGLSSPRPALWFLGSLLLRMSLALAGVYLVSAGHLQRLLLCLFGFVLARLAVTRWIRPAPQDPSRPEGAASHASQP